MPFSIMREIGIDAGHRVPTHGSKCWNIHGHRYTIQATAVASDLHKEGVQTDMVLDFGFLKTIMMEKIDGPCDHGFIMWYHDFLCRDILLTSRHNSEAMRMFDDLGFALVPEDREVNQTKLLIVNFIPTAERLAEFWFRQMVSAVQIASGGLALLAKVEVWETPNCSACYPADLTGLPLSLHELKVTT
jgi:6-pyruvoyltetrahydropterin/6-carboxytetrahydropterin synthase